MAIPDPYKSIIDSIFTASKAGRVHWQETPGGNYYISFDKFSLVLGQSYDNNNQEPEGVEVRLQNATGKIIDYFLISPGENDYKKLDEIVDMARRKARRIDEALSQIANELKSNKPLGEPPPDDTPPIENDELPPGNSGLPF